MSRRSHPDDHALQVARVVSEALSPIRPNHDGVGVAEAGETGDVETGLDGEDHVLFDLDVGAALVDEGPLVALEPDAVAGVMALEVGDAEGLEGVTDVRFGVGEGAAG